MKVALLLLFPLEEAYESIKRARGFNSDEFVQKVLCQKDDVEHRFAKAFLKVGIQPTLYFLSSLGRKEFNHKYGFKIIRIPSFNISIGKRYSILYSLPLFRELTREKFDIIFIESSYYQNYFMPDMHDLLSFFCHSKGCPVISRYAGGSYRFLPPLRRLIKKMALNLNSKIICPSKSELEILRSSFKIDEKKIEYLVNPIDLDVFHEIPKRIAVEHLNKDPEKRYILFVGQIFKEKGVFDLVSALPSIVKDYPNIKLLIVGFGPDEGMLNQMVMKMGLEDHVSIEGFVFHQELRFYYNLADAFVLPTYSGGEGLPSVVLEAIACNTPTISTDVAGIPGVLSEGVGLIIPPLNEVELTGAIKKVLNGNFKINQLRRRLLLEDWSLSNCSIKLKKIVEEIT